MTHHTILRHKSWHPLKEDNLQRVARDKLLHAEEIAQKQKRGLEIDSEQRLEKLRDRASKRKRSDDRANQTQGNFKRRKEGEREQELEGEGGGLRNWLLLPQGDKERKEGEDTSFPEPHPEVMAERKAERDKLERQMTSFLGQGSAESAAVKPWYYNAPSEAPTRTEAQEEKLERRRNELDPLSLVKGFIKVKDDKQQAIIKQQQIEAREAARRDRFSHRSHTRSHHHQQHHHTSTTSSSHSQAERKPDIVNVRDKDQEKEKEKEQDTEKKAKNEKKKEKKRVKKEHKKEKKAKKKNKKAKKDDEKEDEEEEIKSLEQEEMEKRIKIDKLRAERIARESTEKNKVALLMPSQRGATAASELFPGRYNSGFNPEFARGHHEDHSRRQHYSNDYRRHDRDSRDRERDRDRDRDRDNRPRDRDRYFDSNSRGNRYYDANRRSHPNWGNLTTRERGGASMRDDY